VVLGDTRGANEQTLTSISPDLAAIATAIAADRPDLVINA
jgi:hypothetical protein